MRLLGQFLCRRPLEIVSCHETKLYFRRLIGTTSVCQSDYKTCSVQQDQPDTKILKVAIVGCPNVGKSTVINQVVGRRIFAMSKKVHTTQCCARAVLNEGTTQIVFLDTPGLVSAKEVEKYKLDSSYFRGGEEAILEADLIGVVHDVANTFTREKLDPKILRLLHLYKEKDSILILNKIDTLKSKRLLLNLSKTLTGGLLRTSPPSSSPTPQKLSEMDIQKIIKDDFQWTHFNEVFMVSALLGTGIDNVRDYLFQTAKTGEWIFPPEKYTDKDPVKIIEETVRSKLLEHLPKEVPYIVDVQLEFLDMDNEELITAVVLVTCETEKLGGLIRGFGGRRVKMIAAEAEQGVADAFLSDVHLQIIVQSKQRAAAKQQANG